MPSDSGEFLFYLTEDGRARLYVRMEGETVWLSQRDMAELFQTSKQYVSLHIQDTFDEREVTSEATVKKYLTGQTEFSRQVERRVEHHELDVVISVGDPVKSVACKTCESLARVKLKAVMLCWPMGDQHEGHPPKGAEVT